jgi:hypothetical protein
MKHKFKVMIFAASMLIGVAKAEAQTQATCCSFDGTYGYGCSLSNDATLLSSLQCPNGVAVLNCGENTALVCTQGKIFGRTMALQPKGLTCQCATLDTTNGTL